MNERRLFVGYHGASEQFSPPELVELGVAAEAAGFDGLTLADHFHPWQDNQGHAGHAWTMLAAVGARTERIELGAGVTCPTYRYNPADVAHAFATLAVLCPGRLFLGVGTGEAVNEVAAGGGWEPHPQRLERLDEAVRLIRKLWTGERVDFEGKYYWVQSARVYDRPDAPPPIYVAASGPRAAALAGRVGDGWVTDVGTVRGRDSPARRAFEQAAREAGKQPGSMELSTELWAVVGSREEALEAARLWRFIPAFNDVVDIADPREIQRLAEEGVTLERAIDGWVVSEDPADHIGAVRELFDLGVTRVFVHSPQQDQRRVIDFYAREVLPALRR